MKRPHTIEWGRWRPHTVSGGMAEAAEGWVAEYDPQLFLMAVVATATVLSMVIFIAVKGR